MDNKGCKFAYYEDLSSHMPRLKCNINNGNCVYSKVCYKVNKYIINEEVYKECPLMIDALRKEIPNGSYYIQTARPSRNGKLYLYVVVDDHIEKVLTDFTEINQNYVFLYKKNGEYEVSLEKRKNVKK